MALAAEGTTEVEEWVVTWFPPDRPDREKRFKGDRAEERAQRHAVKDGVLEWHPILEHRITTKMVVSEVVPLPSEYEVREWATKTAGVLALKAMAADMHGVHEARKSYVVDWLMDYDRETLYESYRLSTRALREGS